MSNFASLLEDGLTYATVLNGLCIRLFGQEYLNWDPDVVEAELKKITDDIPQINLDKIQAVSTLMTTELFYNYWEAFEKICNCFNSDSPMFADFTPLDSDDMFWAVIEAQLNDSDQFEKEQPFSDEVQEYMVQIMKKDGVLRLPPFVSIRVALKKIPDLTSTVVGEGLQQQRDYEKDLNEMIRTRLKQIQTQSAALNL